ncbi:MAG: hypothetical protein ACI87A_001170 [Planctomycetota bacterium]|jgi:hypothetical protein
MIRINMQGIGRILGDYGLWRAPVVLACLGMALATPAEAQCVFSEDQTFSPADLAMGDIYGGAVGVSGDTIFVMSEWDDDNGMDSGSAYIYERVGSTWIEVQKIAPVDGVAGDNFGRSVAVQADTAVIGAHWDDTVGGFRAGSAYVYEFNGADWQAIKKLVPFDTAAGDAFGNACAIDGDVLAVTAWRDDVVGTDSGSVYVWRDNGVEWSFEQKLVPSDMANLDQFGRGVWISDDVMVIGAWKNDDDGMDSGCAYVFRYDGMNWIEEQKLTASDAAAGDQFGFSVSMDTDVILIGSHRADAGVAASGAAYVFRYDGMTWVEEQKLTASDSIAGNWMGWAVAIDGDTALVSAHHSFDLPLVSPGAGYLFRYKNGVWTEEQKLIASAGVNGDVLGFHLALDGDTAVMGAWRVDSNTGEAYVYDTARNDFNGDDVPDECQPLHADIDQISLISGGTQAFTLDAGVANANSSYWMFGSFSGISPGIAFPGGVVLPLNFDSYFNITLTKPMAGAFTNYLSSLSPSGTAAASFNLPPGLDPSLAGVTLYHAYVAAAVFGVVDYTSNAMPVLLVL